MTESERSNAAQGSLVDELVPALVFGFDWAHRKVESAVLLEGDRARRRVSMDVTVPSLPWGPDEEDPPQVLVPLGTFAKDDMRQFDATDETGRSVSVLTAVDNANLATAFLIALIRAETGQEIEDAEKDEVRLCVESELPSSMHAAQGLVRRVGLDDTISQEFLERLAAEFILFALLPAEMAGRRTVVKFSYHWTVRHRLRARARDRVRDMGRRVMAGLGMRPYQLEIELGRPDTAMSLHLEVQAPAGLHCAGLTLFNEEGVPVARDTTAGMVSHTHASTFDAPVRGTVRFDPDLDGIHRVVTWSAFGVALLLLATRWRLNLVALDPGTPVSLLLFGPALLLTWLVRPGENWIVSEIVGPLRAIAMGLAGSLFAVAFGLSVGFDAPPFASRWGELADIGWKAAIGVSVVTGTLLAIGRARLRARMTKGDDHG
jgi:hypothetical protein